jgi:hypothetical protein
MPEIPESTKRSRRIAAGWVYVEGWMPSDSACTAEALDLIYKFEEEAERIASTPQPKGRPRKDVDKVE